LIIKTAGTIQSLHGYGSIPIDTVYILGDEHPFATYFDVHQGYMVLTHSHIKYKMFGHRAKLETNVIPSPDSLI